MNNANTTDKVYEDKWGGDWVQRTLSHHYSDGTEHQFNVNDVVTTDKVSAKREMHT